MYLTRKEAQGCINLLAQLEFIPISHALGLKEYDLWRFLKTQDSRGTLVGEVQRRLYNRGIRLSLMN